MGFRISVPDLRTGRAAGVSLEVQLSPSNGNGTRFAAIAGISAGGGAPGIIEWFIFAEESFLAMGALDRSGGEVSVVGGGAEKTEGTVNLIIAR